MPEEPRTEQPAPHHSRRRIAIVLLCLLAVLSLLESEDLQSRFLTLQGASLRGDTKTNIDIKDVIAKHMDRGAAKAIVDPQKENGMSLDSTKRDSSVISTFDEFHESSDQTKHRDDVKQGDLSSIHDITKRAKDARDKMIARLKLDYGEEHFAKIFEDDGVSRGRTAFISASEGSTISVERFKRKLKMKLLTVLQSADEAHRTGDSSRRKLDGEAAEYYARMVWATGGHSASAGHGNLFNQSYTAFMERAVSDVFGAVGIDFEARNHAMGGVASGPEIALCSEAVFGTDVDVISYDYGMTDANWYFRKAMYEQRIGLNPSRPAIVDLNIQGSEFNQRRKILKSVEERGLTTFFLDQDVFDDMTANFPDTFGLSEEQIHSLPQMVRHFKCQDTIEKGDPTCRTNKYDNHEICPKRSGMVSWHPGWKMMALWGNLMALFLSDMLVDAVDDLQSESNPSILLDKLRSEEDADYEKFFRSASPDGTEYDMVPLDPDLLISDGVSVFFRRPSICHTAALPSQSRYLGILTETNEIGVHGFYKGTSRSEARKMVSDADIDMPMPLVYDESDHAKECEFELKRDFKDYFFASKPLGWTTLTVPNEAERQTYGRDSEKPIGVLVVCFPPCDWGRCQEGEVRLDSYLNKTMEFEVNGEPVTNITDFAKTCGVLRGEMGHIFRPNDADKFVVRTRVLGDGAPFSFMRMSSLVLL